MPYCRNCGQSVNPGHKYCSNCGAVITESNHDSNIESITPTERCILDAIRIDSKTPEEISQTTETPLYKARSSIRNLVNAGLVVESNGSYAATLIATRGDLIDVKERILKWLNKGGMPTSKEISKSMGIPEEDIDVILNELIREGLVYKKGNYFVSYEYKEEWHKKNKKGLTIASIVVGAVLIVWGTILSIGHEFHFLLVIGIGSFVTGLAIRMSKSWVKWSS